MSQFNPGNIIDGRYEILSLLGEGGMGAVYKARQMDIGRTVAVKVLHAPSSEEQSEAYARFLREARVLNEIVHPNLPAFYHLGQIGNTLYMVMEYLEGKSLQSLLSDGKGLSSSRALAIISQVCSACVAAHNASVVHRDLKPSNIMLVESSGQKDVVKVVDFGLARVVTGSEQKLTNTGLLIGSVHYMSPEQCLGKPADQRSDIYSLACLSFEALTGAPPFEADNPIGLLHKHVNEKPDLGLLRKAPCPSGIAQVIGKAMSKDPAQRYQTMSEFKEDIDLVAAGQGKNIAPIKLESKRSESKTSPTIVLAGLTIILLAAGGLAYLNISSRQKSGSTQVKEVESPLHARLESLNRKLHRKLNAVDHDDGDLHDLYREKGLLLIQMKDFAEARNCFQECLRHPKANDPDYHKANAQMNLVTALWNMNDRTLWPEIEKTLDGCESMMDERLKHGKIMTTDQSRDILLLVRVRILQSVIYAAMSDFKKARQKQESCYPLLETMHQNNIFRSAIAKMDCASTIKNSQELVRLAAPKNSQDQLDFAAMLIGKANHLRRYCPADTSRHSTTLLNEAEKILDSIEKEHLPEWDEQSKRLSRLRSLIEKDDSRTPSD